MRLRGSKGARLGHGRLQLSTAQLPRSTPPAQAKPADGTITRGKSKNPRPKDKFGLTQETTTEPIN
ncbi:60S ribosomal protein L24 [Puccinia graminis f. sp. tritici]|uniref:60S ribosomal protein L24 n=1 Tax=Puccinia graminis f. sp. tritici TaxID=56615 RepID=A0A5B0RQ42_PUCGR|nr:60S ribosomal protein L24 [Puccinia graminis f. sp. tritici]KAA1127910.1 60S ribosomal protein L24 [Puccinia graminis f. sp. tritici]